MSKSIYQGCLPKPLAGRTAIITGSGRNIGKAIALQFARAGANVIVNGHRDKKALDNVVAQIQDMGGKAAAVIADVGIPKDIQRIVKTAEKVFGQVDITVSNAALRPKQPLLEMTIDDWHHVMSVNLHSAFYLARAVLPGMQKRGWGRVIHIAGEDGFAGHQNFRAHAIVSKAAIHAFSKALTTEFGASGITANTVSPGPTDTLRDWSQYPKGWARKRVEGIPLKRVATVDDVAAACLYLAGESASFISGQAIHVNGGEHMYY